MSFDENPMDERFERDQMTDEIKRLQSELKDTYKKGFIDGITCYAHWEDSKQWVGTTGTSLEEAKTKIKKAWNYSPPRSFKEEADQ